MKTLDEFNDERFAEHVRLNTNEPQRNGIACPTCDSELFDSNPMMVLTSNPPKKNIHCAACGYSGYRFA